MAIDEKERLRRWRLVLGKSAEEGLCGASGSGAGGELELSGRDQGMDSVLEALYDTERSAGLGSSSPKVARWLGDIRTYFSSPTVRVLQWTVCGAGAVLVLVVGALWRRLRSARSHLPPANGKTDPG